MICTLSAQQTEVRLRLDLGQMMKIVAIVSSSRVNIHLLHAE